ncbi:NAD-dependent epimerase/dehydratase family protein [Desulfobotulus mexicanus]|uniref:NAD-dependent epimerase/dehydratase family protein n=1 Tax=Desulfobotulus mexicanus TaxID=2586642 RepID=UPI002482B7FE|nr:NAD-dependent epimerase/dehydratase family protein [Desulfobotulus mexicanus]
MDSAHTYSHLYGLPTTGLRFFTVYGPWGRPDMAPSLFASAMMEDRPIRVFNEGRMQRDFTYIDDIVEGVLRIMDVPAMPDPSFNRNHPAAAISDAPFRVYNIGNHEPVELMTFIETMEKAMGREAKKEMLPMQPGDVLATWADIDALYGVSGFKPYTPLEEGIIKFVEWFAQYHRLK